MTSRKIEIRPQNTLSITVQLVPGKDKEIMPKNPSGFYFNDEHYVFIDVQGGRAKFMTVARENIESIVIHIS